MRIAEHRHRLGAARRPGGLGDRRRLSPGGYVTRNTVRTISRAECRRWGCRRSACRGSTDPLRPFAGEDRCNERIQRGGAAACRHADDAACRAARRVRQRRRLGQSENRDQLRANGPCAAARLLRPVSQGAHDHPCQRAGFRHQYPHGSGHGTSRRSPGQLGRHRRSEYSPADGGAHQRRRRFHAGGRCGRAAEPAVVRVLRNLRFQGSHREARGGGPDTRHAPGTGDCGILGPDRLYEEFFREDPDGVAVLRRRGCQRRRQVAAGRS